MFSVRIESEKMMISPKVSNLQESFELNHGHRGCIFGGYKFRGVEILDLTKTPDVYQLSCFRHYGTGCGKKFTGCSKVTCQEDICRRKCVVPGVLYPSFDILQFNFSALRYITRYTLKIRKIQ